MNKDNTEVVETIKNVSRRDFLKFATSVMLSSIVPILPEFDQEIMWEKVEGDAVTDMFTKSSLRDIMWKFHGVRNDSNKKFLRYGRLFSGELFQSNKENYVQLTISSPFAKTVQFGEKNPQTTGIFECYDTGGSIISSTVNTNLLKKAIQRFPNCKIEFLFWGDINLPFTVNEFVNKYLGPDECLPKDIKEIMPVSTLSNTPNPRQFSDYCEAMINRNDMYIIKVTSQNKEAECSYYQAIVGTNIGKREV